MASSNPDSEKRHFLVYRVSGSGGDNPNADSESDAFRSKLEWVGIYHLIVMLEYRGCGDW